MTTVIDTYIERIHTAFGDTQEMRDILAYATIESERDCHVIVMATIRSMIFDVSDDLPITKAAYLINRVDDMLMMLCESDMMPLADALLLLRMMIDLDLSCTHQWYETMMDNAPSEHWADNVLNAYVTMNDPRGDAR